MKNASLLPLLMGFLLVGTASTAQETPHEVGFQFRNFDNFSFIYKKRRAENKFLRFSAGSFDLRYLNQKVNGGNAQSFSSGLTFAMGWENRLNLTSDFQFLHGFRPSLGVSYGNAKRTGFAPNFSETLSLRPGIGYLLGFQYQAGDHFLINIEAAPTLTGGISLDYSRAPSYSLGANFSASTLAVGVLYRW